EHLRIGVQTARAYCDRLAAPDAFLLFAGREPASFRRLFPFWTTTVAPTDLAIDLRVAHDNLFDHRHSTVELREYKRERERSSAPDSASGLPLRFRVDSRYLEAYLAEAEFEREFKMSREQFYALPRWRQTALKKDLNLL